MTNRIASRIALGGAIASLAYFAALQINSPGILAFTDAWLLLAGVLCWGWRQIRQRPANARYAFLPQVRPGVRRAVAAFLAAGGVVACVNLFFICRPVVNDGTVETKYVIVLGGGVRSDGTISRVPRERLRTAAAYLAEHPGSYAVVSGGQLRFLPYVEAPILARELEAMGIAPERIIQEGQAQDTIQNLEYSAALIAEREGVSLDEVLGMPVTIVTSGFHLARAERLARRLGFSSVYGLGARVPVIQLVNAYCREICSYVKLNLRILLTGRPRSLVAH